MTSKLSRKICRYSWGYRVLYLGSWTWFQWATSLTPIIFVHIYIYMYWKIKNYDFKILFIFYAHHHVINKVATLPSTVYNCVNSKWIIAEQIFSFILILTYFFNFNLHSFHSSPLHLSSCHWSTLTNPPLIHSFPWVRFPMGSQQHGKLMRCGAVPSPSPCIKFWHGIQL